MPNVITVEYGRREYGQRDITEKAVGEWMSKIANADKAFDEVMNKLAWSYIVHGSEADFGIVDSFDIYDICGSSQCMFPRDLEQALKKHGVYDVKVDALFMGSFEKAQERIREYGSDPVHLDGITQGGSSTVMYKFERTKER